MKKSIRIRVLETVGPLLQRARVFKLRKFKGYRNISTSAVIESDVLLDRVSPENIFIGENTLVAAQAVILCHEHVKRNVEESNLPLILPVTIGSNCFIGVRAVILPGVEIGDSCIIGAGAVVSKNVEANSIYVGNPGKVVRSNIKMNNKAIRIK